MKRPKLDIDNWIILEGYRGSIAHGTYIPSGDSAIDDRDLLGVAVPPIDYYFGLGKFEQKEIKTGIWDILVYEIRKYFRLLLKSNPNVLGLLFIQKNLYTKITPLGELLIQNRDLFVSKQCYKTFCGYAYGQLKRMTHFNKDEAYKQAYMGEKRRRLVEKFGYDVKNAAHLIRLLRMGIELLTTGELNVMRPDNNYLIEIKQGKYELKKINEEADRLFKLMDEAFVRSNMQDYPKYDEIEKLLVKIIKEKVRIEVIERVIK